MQMTQISLDTTDCAHQTCFALPALIPTSAPSTLALTGESEWPPTWRNVCFPLNLLVRQLPLEGGQDGKNVCP